MHHNDRSQLYTWLRLPLLLLALIFTLAVRTPAVAADAILPPVTTATPGSGTFLTAQNVTLSCDDQSGGICAGSFFCFGSDCAPTTPYSAPFAITGSTTLRFYSRDAFGNQEAVKTQKYNFVGSISGSVTESGSGNAMVGVTVNVYDAVSGTSVGSGSTDSSGTYQIPSLPNGYYNVVFSKSGYIDQGYSGGNNGYPVGSVTVFGPSNISGINAVMVKAGTITGIVTRKDTGTVIPNINVSAYDAVTGYYVFSGYTNSEGSYSITNLTAGSYKLGFGVVSYLNILYGNAVYAGQWYSNKASSSSATTVAVVAGGTTSGINAAMVIAGSITGTVTDIATGAAIPWVQVSVVDASTGEQVKYVNADSSGKYSISGLSGSYKLQFTATSFAAQWYGGSVDQSTAGLVVVNAPNTTAGINMSLSKGASISGTVTDITGAGISSAGVTAYNAAGTVVGNSSTDSAGAYNLSGLATGAYKLRFTSYGYFERWSGGKIDQASAVAVAVTAPNTTNGVNAVLNKGATITGVVTDKETGAPVSGVLVMVGNAAGGEWESSYTNSLGVYNISGLAGGGYIIKCWSVSTAQYVSQSYINKTGSSNIVAVIAPGTVAGIDFALQKEAIITGTVTDRDTGFNVMGVSVTAYNATTNAWGNSVKTDGSGTYNLDGLEGGDYKLFFEGGGYKGAWFNGKTDQSTATIVSATANHTTPAINMALTKGGSISGIVADRSTGTGIENANIYLIDRSTGDYIPGGSTDSNGHYSVTGLGNSSYSVRIEPNDSHLPKWYGSHDNYPCADTVSVTAPNAITGIDALLDSGGSISGQVTDAATGLGIPGISFYWENSSNQAAMAHTTVNDNGAYTISGLSPGDYVLSFSAADYVGASSNTVKISGASLVTGVDLSLARGAAISGRVTDSTTGKGVAGALVEAADTKTGVVYASDLSDNNGNYRISGLPSGSYSVRNSPGNQGMAGGVNNTNTVAFSPFWPILQLPTVVGPADLNVTVGVGTAGAISGSMLSISTGTNNLGTVLGASGANLINTAMITAKVPAFAVVADTSNREVTHPPSGHEVSVTAPNITDGIDFTVDPTGAIAGLVIDDASGQPLYSVGVTAFDAVTGANAGSSNTDSTGAFIINGLPSGNYRVRFYGYDVSSGGYLTKWSGSETGSTEGTAVAVLAPATTSGVDARLAKGGGITGSVSLNSCSDARTLLINVYDAASGKRVSQTAIDTNNSDRFVFGSLPAGSYKVTIASWDGTVVQQWYPNKTNAASAEPITVNAGAVTGGINFQLALGGGSIAGQVSAETGCGAVSGPIKLYDWFSGGLVAETGAYYNGNYLLNGLPDGTYQLLFSGNEVPRWYRKSGATVAASPIVVSGGIALTGIDFDQACMSSDSTTGTGVVPTLADVLKALRIAVGLDAVTPQSLAAFDLAPVVAGVSMPDGKIDIADVLIVLQKLVNSPVVAGQL
jgi:hypothetical protein